MSPAEGDRADVVVLGSGPGGYSAAFRAADLGLRTVLVERHARLGGVCLNVGCIPSKALLHTAALIAQAHDAAAHGLRFGAPDIDLDAIRAWKDGVVDRLTGGLDGLARGRKVEVVHGTGRFTGPHELAVEGPDGTTTVAFEHAIVAAGSSAVRLPGLPYDDPRVMDSTGALALADVPERLLVVGGGIIGMEMATVYDALGAEVTVVELLDQLIPGCDPDLVRPLARRVADRYAAIHLDTRVTGIEALEDGLRVSFEGGDAPGRAMFDRVLVAVGRRPNGHDFGADAAGVRVDERGFVLVDPVSLRTSAPHILAIGDVIGEPMLAHKASHEGKVAAEVIAGEPGAGYDAVAIPSVAYTDPEVAWAGLTEARAKADGIEHEIARFPWSASGRALTIERPDGLTKLVLEPGTRRILGAGIVGAHAGDLISEAVLAMETGAVAEDVALTIHPHPTLSETVMFAAEVGAGTITDLPPARRPAAR